jgi:hypothetical protein
MKKSFYFFGAMLLSSAMFYSCEQSSDDSAAAKKTVSPEVIAKIESLGFNVTDRAPYKFENGYLVEGDIYLTDADLVSMGAGVSIPEAEQYRTTNLVTGTPRNITVYIPSGTFSAAYISALDVALARYNNENLALTFTRVTSSTGATIVFTRLRKGDERQGILGSSGFPTSSGSPYGEVKMSGILQSTYGLTVNGIATIMAHELGHCIGFRHTDYFNRAISCGGATSNEGDGGIGAILIPGTPSGATASAKSWMLACTDGGDRPFNVDDKTALNALY